MSGQINYNLNFNANVSSAITNLNKLKESLNSISSISTGNLTMTKDLSEAVLAAKDLKMHLNNAFNVNTGNIDLKKFQASLAASNQDLATLSTKLLGAGSTGQAAFLQLQSGLSSANLQLVKSNTLLDQFLVTLKNTAKWQLSTTILQGFIGSVQKAYSYAQDLNESLNNIRIVTGQNTDQMAEFAAQANKAAKALSTTTTTYTNASLIYYQQGLTDEQVKERTDVTVKMANVTGDSATTVSDQMTAIWNNFAKAGDNLESYADKIVALGAATASSSDEIAQGLEKFAAVGETVGLSYDYATAALATVVAETRQSADVVGTAFKTLFSRMEQLKQSGETEDGDTTLGQYSQALLNIGVNIKDTNGDLKDMDQILEETGAKWQSLSRDQQVALAQTVAGIRQYSQFIALMDNWGKVQENVVIAQNAEGTLQEQADIYAESWEAAQKRVTASAETIYSSLLDDKFFIKLTNGFADFLDKIELLINSLGGLKGVLGAISVLAIDKLSPSLINSLDEVNLKFTHFSNNLLASTKKVWSSLKETFTLDGLSKTFSNLKSNIKNSFSIQGIKNSQASAKTTRDEQALTGYTYLQQQVQESLTNEKIAKSTDDIFQKQCDSLRQINAESNKLAKFSDKISSNEQQILSSMIDETRELSSQRYDAEKKAEAAIKNANAVKNTVLVDSKPIEGMEGRYVENKTSGLFNVNSIQDSGLFQYETFIDDLLMKVGKTSDEYSQLKFHASQTGKTIATVAQNQQIINDALQVAVDNLKDFAGIEHEIEMVLDNENYSYEDKTVLLQELVKTSEQKYLLTESEKRALNQLNGMMSGTASAEVKINTYRNTGLQNLREQLSVVQTTAKLLGVSEQNVKNIVKSEKEVVDANHEAKIINDRYNASLNSTQNALDKVINRTSSVGTALTSALQIGSRAFMSINMLENAFKSLGDESQSLSQRLSSVFMGLSMGVPIAISGITKLVQGTKSVALTINEARQAVGTYNATISTLNQLTGITINQDALKNALTEAGTILEQQQNSQLAKSLAINEIQQQLEDAGVKTDLARIVSQELVTKGISKDSVAEFVNSGAIDANTKSKEKNVAITIIQHYWLAIIIAAIAALAVGIYALTKAIETDNERLEKFNETNKELQANLKSTTEEWDNLMSAMSDYDDSQKALEDLTKGTTEWNQQLQQTNAQVLALLETYPILASYLKSENGILSIDQAGWDALADQQSYEMYKSTQSVYSSDALRAGQKNTNLLNNSDNSYDLGSVVIDSDLNQDIYEAYRKYGDELFGNIEEFAERVGLNEKFFTTEDAKSLLSGENLTKLKNNIAQLYSNEEQIAEYQTQFIGSKLLETNTEFNNLSSDAQTAVAKALYEQNKNNMTEEAFKASGSDWYDWTGLRMNDEKLHEAYAVYRGWSDNLESASNTILQGNSTFKFKDGSDDITIDDDTMRYELALNDYTNNLKTQTDVLIGLNTRLDSSVQGIGSSIATFGSYLASGNVESFDINTITNDQMAGYEALKNEHQTDIENGNYDWLMTNEEAAALGLESGEAYYKAFESARQNFDSEKSQEIEDAKELAAFNSAISKGAEELDVSEDALKNYAKALSKTNKELKENSEASAEVAIRNTKITKGIEKLKESLEDNLDVLNNWDEDLIETFEAASEVGEALKDVFGVDVSADWIKDNLEDLKDLANGATDKFDELALSAAKDYVLNLGLNDEATDALNTCLDDLAAQAANADIGAEVNLNDANAIDTLNNLLASGQVTAEQIQGAFSAIGWQPDISYKSVDGPSTDISYSGDVNGSLFGKSFSIGSVKGTINANSKIQSPVLGTGSTYLGSGSKAASAGSKNNTSKSGGGGSSKSSDRSTKTDTKGKEPERYHTINKQLSTLKQGYDDLDEAKDRAYGKDKADYIAREIELMDQQISKQREYLAEIDKYRALDWSNITKYGFERDADGVITNYEKIYNQELDKWKDAEARYNAGWIDEDAYDTYKEAFEEFEDLLSKYEESNDLYLENLDSIVTLEAEKLAARLEGIEVKVTAEIDVDEDDLAVLEYLTSKIEDRSYQSVERLAIYGKQVKDYQTQALAYSQAIDEIFNNHDSADWQDSEMEALREYRDSLLDTNSSLLELKTTLQDELSSAFEEVDETMEKSMNNFDHYDSILDHYNSLVELYGKNARGFATGIAAASRQNALNTFMGNQSQLEAYKQQLIEAERAAISANDAGDEALVDHWNTIIDELTQKVQEGQEAVAESWSAAVEAAATEFQTAVQDIIVALDDTLAGMYDDLDQLQDVFDKSEDLKENYLSSSQQSYELTKLSRQINNSASDTMNLNAKAKLNSLLEKINKAYGKIGDSQEYAVKMSQYELEYAQKEYDLLLAQIALEDAQDNKTQMKLVRDSSGNWNYAYTADQSKINEAQQNVEDKQNEIDQLNEQTLKDLSSELIENQRNWKEELAGLSETDFATKEEYEEEINRITDYYKENEDYLVDQLDTLATNMGLTGYEEIDNAAVNAYLQSGGVNGQSEATLDRLSEAFGNYENEVLVATNAAGFSSVSEALENLQASSEVLTEASNATQVQIADDTAEIKSYLAQVADTLVNWNESYLKNLNDAILSNEEQIDKVNAAAGEGSALETLTKASSFASGGYTGEWSDGGKLGILHQKELILNEYDTSNLLAAASMLRMIAPNISSGLSGAALAHAGMLGDAIGASGVNETENTIQQAVSIEANFPGVQSAAEIENALNNIVNQAAQYAAIKKLQ